MNIQRAVWTRGCSAMVAALGLAAISASAAAAPCPECLAPFGEVREQCEAIAAEISEIQSYDCYGDPECELYQLDLLQAYYDLFWTYGCHQLV